MISGAVTKILSTEPSQKPNRAVYKAAYYANNKEKITAYQAAYRVANKEQILATQAAWNAANKEQKAAYNVAYNAANKEQKATSNVAYRAANKDKIAKRRAAHYAANKDKIAKRRAAYYAANKEKRAKQNAAYTTANRVEIRATQNTSNRNRKLTLIEHMGGKCKDCLGTFPPSVYEFHHVDPSIKDAKASKLFTKGLTAQVIEELKKCVMLCANCHRIRHATLDM